MTFQERWQHNKKTNKGFMVSKIVLLVFGALLFYAAISNFFSSLEYLNSEKVETTAIIQEIDGVKTYSFPAMDYGVVGRDPEIEDIGDVGDKVTIYYQKDKPHVVYRSEKPKQIWLDVIGPLLYSVFLIGFVCLVKWVENKLSVKEDVSL